MPSSSPSGSRAALWWVLATIGVAVIAVVVTIVLNDTTEEAVEDTATTVAAQSTTTSSGEGSVPVTDAADTTDATETTEATDTTESAGGNGENPPPTPPLTGLSAVISSDGVLSVSWEDPGNETGYAVSVTPGGSSTLPADVTAFEREPVPCGTPIVVELVAHGTAGATLAAGRVTAAAVDCGPQLAPPSNLRIFDIADGDAPMDLFEIQWDDATGETGYVLTIDRTDGWGEAGPQGVSEFDANTTRAVEALGCQDHIEATLEAVAPDGSRFGAITGSFDGPRCTASVLIGNVEIAVASVQVPGGGLRDVTATCPGSLDIVGGGFGYNGMNGPAIAADGRYPIIVGNRPVGNGWQVTVAAAPGADLVAQAVALCIPGGATSTVESPTVGPSQGSRAQASCPAGTVLTGGGWWADVLMEVTQSLPDSNVRGWIASATGEPVLATGGIRAYAVCLQHDRLEATMVFDSYEVPAGASGGVESPACPDGSLLTGGGLAVEEGPLLFSSPESEGDVGQMFWLAIVDNIHDAGNLVTSGAVCLTVP